MLRRAKTEAECRAGCTSASRRCLRAAAAHRDVAARQAEVPFRVCLQLRLIPNLGTDGHPVWCLFLWFLAWVFFFFFFPPLVMPLESASGFSRGSHSLVTVPSEMGRLLRRLRGSHSRQLPGPCRGGRRGSIRGQCSG